MRTMKHLRIAASALVALLIALAVTACGDDPPTIGILEPDLGASTEATRLAFLEALKADGFAAGDNVRFFRRNYEFRDDPYDELADYLANEKKVDYFFAMSPEALDAIANVAGGRPIVYAFAGGIVNRPPNAVGVSIAAGPAADHKGLGSAAGHIMSQVLRGVPIAEIQAPAIR